MSKTLTRLLVFAAASAAGAALAQDGEVQTKQYEDGGIYEGTFKAGKRQGTGTMRYASGEEASGDWDNGALTDATTGEAASETATAAEQTDAETPPSDDAPAEAAPATDN